MNNLKKTLNNVKKKIILLPRDSQIIPKEVIITLRIPICSDIHRDSDLENLSFLTWVVSDFHYLLSDVIIRFGRMFANVSQSLYGNDERVHEPEDDPVPVQLLRMGTKEGDACFSIIVNNTSIT